MEEAFDKMIRLVIKNSGAAPVHHCLLYLHDAKSGFKYAAAAGHRDESGGAAASCQDRFRTGSITKPFTAALVLQLMEEGMLALDDPFLDLVSNDIRAFLKDLLVIQGINYTDAITIKKLLQHRSGLRDYFTDDQRFFEQITHFPDRGWNWQSVMEKYFEYGLHEKGVFKPGEGFYYADTNYLLLAVVIEEITNQPFHAALEKRILKPLALHDTYLEFYQESKGNSPIVFPSYGSYSLQEINTSFDWGGGGLISSVRDLDIFVRALLSGQLFRRAATLNGLLHFAEESAGNSSGREKAVYGMGLQQKKIGGHYFTGHNSAYGALMFFDRVSDISIILTLDQAAALHKAEWMMHKAVKEYVSYISM